ncbi:helix-turn-helix domain-containing protein [Agreia sp. Leaf210]|uniref:helix-turn-helix domain-containing protein n=1 Tax=Agreia sp. Leaf210 TaxID=1735682 RepID=UPI00138EFFF4|nr:MerR family transcriptional regulator [Agreia sp. Leaf210]
MHSKERLTAALTTAQVVALAQVHPSTLNYWISKNLCQPSVIGPSGQRATRYWSVEDLVTVKAVKALREVGCSLQNIRKAKGLLNRHPQTLASATLYYNGRDIWLIDDATDSIVSVLEQAGQAIFSETLLMMTLPLRLWIRNAEKNAQLVDATEIETARRRRRIARQSSRDGRLHLEESTA